MLTYIHTKKNSTFQHQKKKPPGSKSAATSRNPAASASAPTSASGPPRPSSRRPLACRSRWSRTSRRSSARCVSGRPPRLSRRTPFTTSRASPPSAPWRARAAPARRSTRTGPSSSGQVVTGKKVGRGKGGGEREREREGRNRRGETSSFYVCSFSVERFLSVSVLAHQSTNNLFLSFFSLSPRVSGGKLGARKRNKEIFFIFLGQLDFSSLENQSATAALPALLPKTTQSAREQPPSLLAP